MTVDEPDVSTLAVNPAVKSGHCAGKQAGLESLLLDDVNRTTVAKIVAAEVRVVGVAKKGNYAALVVLFLLAILILGGGYYYLQQLSPLPAPVSQPKLFAPAKLPIPDRPELELNTDIGSIVTVPDGRDSAPVVSDKSSIEALPSGLDRSTVVEPQLYTVSVGPLINSTDIYQAVKSLQELGFQPQMTPGSGPVKMFRLFEGIYSVSEARIHLAALKKNVGSAFMLPTGNKMAVYAGSFHQETRAKLMQNNLVAEKIKVELVSTEVVMNGTMLTVLQADKQTASEILADIAGLGLFARMEVKK